VRPLTVAKSVDASADLLQSAANRGDTLPNLLADAESRATPNYDADFYDEISWLVPGLASSAERGSLALNVTLPEGALHGKAVLSQVGHDFQVRID